MRCVDRTICFPYSVIHHCLCRSDPIKCTETFSEIGGRSKTGHISYLTDIVLPGFKQKHCFIEPVIPQVIGGGNPEQCFHLPVKVHPRQSQMFTQVFDAEIGVFILRVTMLSSLSLNNSSTFISLHTSTLSIVPARRFFI